jgi:hypothetical protein
MGATNCTLANQYATMPICCAGGSGIFVGANNVFPGYYESSSVVMSIVYLLLLLWLFMGVAMAADVFMAAIETITSTVSIVKNTMPGNCCRPSSFCQPTYVPVAASARGRAARIATTRVPTRRMRWLPPRAATPAPSHVGDCVCVLRARVVAQTARFAASVRARGTPPWPT